MATKSSQPTDGKEDKIEFNDPTKSFPNNPAEDIMDVKHYLDMAAEFGMTVEVVYTALQDKSDIKPHEKLRDACYEWDVA